VSTDLREALKSLSYGLYVLTVADKGTRNAMVASWVSQVSLSPPRIMVAVKKSRRTHPMLESAAGFGLMVVQKGKEKELGAYKGDDPEGKFAERDITTGKSGAPLLSGYLAAFDLTIVDRIDAGDHTLFIGEVLWADVTPGGVPATTLDYGKTYIGD
jgi:flavin reductase (DIM6/NTAB) family NADH-FMN oxidoreductase RutF